MRPSSSNSPAERLQDLLDTEAALARAKADVGLIDRAEAAEIAQVCRAALYDPLQLAEAAELHATPVVALVEQLRERLPEDLGEAVHRPATSQDIVDSALMLRARRVLAELLSGLEECADAVAALDERHGAAPQMARTLLQPALPSTFGSLLGAWMSGIEDARAHLTAVLERSLAAQLAGPTGDLDDPALLAAFARRLGLPAPDRPWHTVRTRVVDLAVALALTVGSLGKIAQDVVLLSQAELGELAEGAGPGMGGGTGAVGAGGTAASRQGAAGRGAAGRSSAMPHKRNPARAVQIAALAQRAPGLVATVLAGLPQELHRAAGRWQAEDETMRELLDVASRAVGHGRVLLGGLGVDEERMRGNLR